MLQQAGPGSLAPPLYPHIFNTQGTHQLAESEQSHLQHQRYLSLVLVEIPQVPPAQTRCIQRHWRAEAVPGKLTSRGVNE